jgi:hypothetical protein
VVVLLVAWYSAKDRRGQQGERLQLSAALCVPHTGDLIGVLTGCYVVIPHTLVLCALRIACCNN